MRDLTDDELFELANDYLEKNKRHGVASIILAVLGIIQSVFFPFDKINITPYILITTIVCGISYYHLRQGKKSLYKVDEILKEFDSRI